jgi:hypothetical protein
MACSFGTWLQLMMRGEGGMPAGSSTSTNTSSSSSSSSSRRGCAACAAPASKGQREQ